MHLIKEKIKERYVKICIAMNIRIVDHFDDNCISFLVITTKHSRNIEHKKAQKQFQTSSNFFPLSRKKFPKYHIKPYNILEYHTLKNPLKKKKTKNTDYKKKAIPNLYTHLLHTERKIRKNSKAKNERDTSVTRYTCHE